VSSFLFNWSSLNSERRKTIAEIQVVAINNGIAIAENALPDDHKFSAPSPFIDT
jgi:hypothetical protein